MPGTRGSWILQLKPYQFQEKGTQQLLKITEKGDPDEAAIQVSRINKNCQNGKGTRGPMKKRKEKKGSCSEVYLKSRASFEADFLACISTASEKHFACSFFEPCANDPHSGPDDIAHVCNDQRLRRTLFSTRPPEIDRKTNHSSNPRSRLEAAIRVLWHATPTRGRCIH